MGAEDNGLTLEGLAHRLEALQHENAENAERLETLERENERMRSENAELREEVAPLRSSGTRWEEVVALRGSTTRQVAKPAAESDGQVSRRALIRKAGAAAVAAVAAGTLLSPHEAKAATRFGDVDAQNILAHVGWMLSVIMLIGPPSLAKAWAPDPE